MRGAQHPTLIFIRCLATPLMTYLRAYNSTYSPAYNLASAAAIQVRKHSQLESNLQKFQAQVSNLSSGCFPASSTIEPYQSATRRGPKRYFLRVPDGGGFEGLRGPLVPSLSPTPPFDGCFLDPGSSAEQGWFCQLVCLPIDRIR